MPRSWAAHCVQSELVQLSADRVLYHDGRAIEQETCALPNKHTETATRPQHLDAPYGTTDIQLHDLPERQAFLHTMTLVTRRCPLM